MIFTPRAVTVDAVLNERIEAVDDADLRRVYWRSRRGLLELDLRLVPFARDHYPQLSIELKRQYRDLLQQEDQDILAWLNGQTAPPDAFGEIIGTIAGRAL